MTVTTTTIPAIVANIDPGDGYSYRCILAGDAIAIHAPVLGVSYTDTGYGLRNPPPGAGWCKARVEATAPRMPKATRLRIATVLQMALAVAYEMIVGAP